jgi:hypothetical protein
MSIKFSVGVSEAEEDRVLLEERRQSPARLSHDSDDEPTARPAGWPLSSQSSQEEEDEPIDLPSTWAW